MRQGGESEKAAPDRSVLASPIWIGDVAELTPVPRVSPDEEPLYVCVCGQTGAGKSTILEFVAELVGRHRQHLVVLDEKALHHPYLDQLFIEPEHFALELQLQFMVARILFTKRWLAAGFSVITERSHLEDPVFIRHLRALGYVSDAEQAAYMSVWSACGNRLQLPDALIALEVDADVAIDRLAHGDPGSRPSFPDRESRRQWITVWHALYRKRFDELQADRRLAGRVGRFPSPVDRQRLAGFLRQSLAVN